MSTKEKEKKAKKLVGSVAVSKGHQPVLLPRSWDLRYVYVRRVLGGRLARAEPVGTALR